MLYNIGLDVSPTVLVCVSPPGAIFDKNHAELLENQLRSRDSNLGNRHKYSDAGKSTGI